MTPFTCHGPGSFADDTSDVCHNGKRLTTGEVVDLLNLLPCTADGVPLVTHGRGPLYCPRCNAPIETRCSASGICHPCQLAGVPDAWRTRYTDCLSKPKESP